MKLVFCTISIVFNLNGLNFYGKESLKGQIKAESKTKYIVDFSKSINSSYVGDYSKILVNKDECVRIK